jgi:glucose/arabinose dehydrogenase
MLRRLVLLALSALFVAPTPGPGQTLPSGFTLEQVVAGPFAGEPSGFAFLPDGRILLLERNSGNVRLAAVGSSTSSIVLTIPDIEFTLERGLLGIAVDPAWPARPYVYVYYTHTTNTGRVAMYTATGDLTDGQSSNLSLGSAYLVLTFTDATPLHNGGTLRFGPDGMLYLSVGEDLSECNAQNLATIAGGIYRLDVSSMPGVGTGPPPKADITPIDNPFPGPNENERLTYAWGLRNPFRFDVDPSTGDLLIGDVGFVTTEEVDWIPQASGGGQNFGWPIWEGNDPTNFGATCGEKNAHTFPAFAFPHGPGSAAVVGGAFVRTGTPTSVSLPSGYDGSFFVIEYISGVIRRIVNVEGVWQLAAPVPGQPSADLWATGIPWITEMRTGPDGALWLCTRNASKTTARGIHRITFDQTTAAPILASSDIGWAVSPNPAAAGSPVTFAWSLPRSVAGSLTIYDVAGRRVHTVTEGTLSEHGSADWSTGERGAGVYFYRLASNEGVLREGKVTLLR